MTVEGRPDRKNIQREPLNEKKDRITKKVMDALSENGRENAYDPDLVDAAIEREIGTIIVDGLLYAPVKPEEKQIDRIVAEIRELQKNRL